jgi:hypothetical protein
MEYNTCHIQNIKLIITILQKYFTGLHRFAVIDTKFEFKFKLKLNKTRNLNSGIVEGQFP